MDFYRKPPQTVRKLYLQSTGPQYLVVIYAMQIYILWFTSSVFEFSASLASCTRFPHRSPFLAPLPCWRTLTVVLSNITIVLSANFCAIRAWNTFSHICSIAYVWNWLYTICYERSVLTSYAKASLYSANIGLRLTFCSYFGQVIRLGAFFLREEVFYSIPFVSLISSHAFS